MNDSTALDNFLDKWRSHWPEWQVAEVFVPAAQRETVVAWFALLHEFEEAMNVAGDPLPADAKLAWWGEELRDWSRQRSRHPLGRLLEPNAAPWFELAENLPALIRLREPPRDAQDAFDTARPLAQAMAAVESALFAAPVSEAATIAIATQLLASRLFAMGVSAAPADTDGQAWATHLSRQWPSPVTGALPRRIWAVLARARLVRFRQEENRVHAVSRWRTLWLSWRAARG